MQVATNREKGTRHFPFFFFNGFYPEGRLYLGALRTWIESVKKNQRTEFGTTTGNGYS